MKKIAITLLSVAAATSMYAQGNFNFNNLSSSGAITINSSNNAGAAEGAGGFFVGTGYTASLYWGAASATQFGQLTYFPITGGDPVFFGAGVADADQSAFAGNFDGGNVGFPATANIPIEVAVAVWWSGPGSGGHGAATSYAQAVADGYNAGISGLVPITLTTSADPSTIQDLTALASFTVGTVAPEPTTLALCGLGAASLLLFRRKTVNTNEKNNA